MGTVWNVTIDLKLQNVCDVRKFLKMFENEVKGDLSKGCETYNAICYIFQKLEEDFLDLIINTMKISTLFFEDSFDGSYSVGYALYEAFSKPFNEMPFGDGSKIIFDSWEDAGGKYVMTK